MKASPSTQRNITAALLIGVIAISAALAALPWAQWYAFGQDEKIQQRELKSLLSQTKREADLRKENERLISPEQSAGLLIAGDTMGIAGANLQRLINTVVQTHGGQATSLQVLPATEENNLVRMSVSLSISADIDSLRGILYELETGQPLVFVDSMSIATSDTLFGSANLHYLGPLEVTLQVSAYSARKEQPQ